MTIKFLTIEQLIEIHDTFLKQYGGLAGIRDHGLLASSIEMPKVTMFGEDLHKTLFDKSAAYLFHIVKNHPFNDGNKRTGAGSALMFLRVNNVEPNYDTDNFVQLVINVADGKAEKSDVSKFLKDCSNLI